MPQAQPANYQHIVVDNPDVEVGTGYYYTAPVSFHRGVRFESTWTIHVRTATQHQVLASATFVAVCANAGPCYPLDSAEARNLFGPLSSRPAANYRGFVLPAPE